METLREKYGADRLVAMVRNPASLFIYWSLAEKPNMASGQWILRLTSQDTGARSDNVIDPLAGNWYLSVIPGNTYEIEMMIKKSSGDTTRVMTCNPVKMPPMSFSTNVDRDWPMLDKHIMELLGTLGNLPIGSSHTGLTKEREEIWLTVTREMEEKTALKEKMTSPGAS